MSGEGLGQLVVKDYKNSFTIDIQSLYNSQISQYKTLQEEALNNFTKNVKKYNNKFSEKSPNQIWETLNNNLNNSSFWPYKDYITNI